MEFLKLILDYMRWPATLIIISFIFRKPLINLVNKLEKLKYNNGGSTLEAIIFPTEVNSQTTVIAPTTNPTEKKAIDSTDDDKEEKSHWIFETSKELEKGNVEQARELFSKAREGIASEKELFLDKAFFLYMAYDRTNRTEILDELERHITNAKTEEQTTGATSWYISCLEIKKQYKPALILLSKQLETLKESEQITITIVNLAGIHLSNSEYDKAKEIITKRLQDNLNDIEYYRLYNKLAEAEEKLGNEKLSTLCQDKALEYKPDDEDSFLNTAYKASKNNLLAIELSNYDTLTTINPKNSLALNNMGVSAGTIKLNSVSARYFEKSSILGNTLAMANKGNKLYESGLLDAAEEIANKALEKDNPHENIYKLLKDIRTKRSSENEKWQESIDKAFRIQKKLRLYTHAFYINDNQINLVGSWLLNKTIEVTLDKKDGKSFSIEFDNGSKKINIVGTIDNLSLTGVYIEKDISNEVTTLLTSNKNKNFLIYGYYDKDEEKLLLFPQNFDDELDFSLTRKS
ncbi:MULTISPECIES: tetratricopeptide repeat protein [Serratia]|uniref:tetratricopeptide repeat protein n=1 Tax=Serratia TaxID=613 RepID=UPI003CF4D880